MKQVKRGFYYNVDWKDNQVDGEFQDLWENKNWAEALLRITQPS